MINLNKEKQDMINNIENKISKLKEKQNIIDNIKIEPINEQQWEQLTNILEIINRKYILLEIAKATFPNGTDWKLRYDYIEFKLNNITININFQIKPFLYINENWLHSKIDSKKQIIEIDKGKPIREMTNCEIKLRKFVELIDSNNYNYYSVGKILYDTDKLPFKRIRFLLYWISEDKRKLNSYVKTSKEYINKWDNEYKNKIKRYYQRRRYIIQQVRNLKEILPELKQFGETNVDEEYILNFEETINKKKNN